MNSWKPFCGRFPQWVGKMLRRTVRKIFTRENILALMLGILLVLIVMFGIDTAPTWIYQGF